MHTRGSGTRGNIGCVNDKVPHLAVKDIDRYPVQVRSPVRVAINQTKARKTSRGLEYGPRRWVSIHLGKVVWDNGG